MAEPPPLSGPKQVGDCENPDVEISVWAFHAIQRNRDAPGN